MRSQRGTTELRGTTTSSWRHPRPDTDAVLCETADDNDQLKVHGAIGLVLQPLYKTQMAS